MEQKKIILHDHQLKGHDEMSRMEAEGKGGVVADEMGLGKTLMLVSFMQLNKMGFPDLIVCPMSLLSHWVKEINAWYFERDDVEPVIHVHHGAGRVKKFKSAIKDDVDFVITTYALAGDKCLLRQWGRIVLDEAHNIKNGVRAKKPVKCAVAAFKLSRRGIYRWCVTGTPFNNTIDDIASLCRFIGHKPYNGKTWWDAAKNNSDSRISGWRDQFVLRRTKEKLIKPPKYHLIEVDPTDEETRVVEELREKVSEMFREWTGATGRRKIQTQGMILGLIMKLRQVSNSYYCGKKKFNSKRCLKNCAKVNAIVARVEERVKNDPTHGVVVFSQFTSFLSVLKRVMRKKFKKRVKILKFTGDMTAAQRDKVVQKFVESNDPRVLLISLMAGGVGLNLMPCSSVIISEPWYNPFVEKQAEERVHRIGQKHQVNVYKFTMKNGVETWIQGIKAKKMELASELELAKKEKVALTFNFTDLGQLFKKYVGIIKVKTPVKKTVKKTVKRGNILRESS